MRRSKKLLQHEILNQGSTKDLLRKALEWDGNNSQALGILAGIALDEGNKNFEKGPPMIVDCLNHAVVYCANKKGQVG